MPCFSISFLPAGHACSLQNNTIKINKVTKINNALHENQPPPSKTSKKIKTYTILYTHFDLAITQHDHRPICESKVVYELLGVQQH